MAHTLPLAHEPEAPQGDLGHPIAAKGFRPFFLVAGLFAVASVPSWLLFFTGVLRLDGYLEPASWHAHEMIFGFGVAVIAGFLLTAVGNWTQRETLVRMPLLALVGLWALGRVGMLCAQRLPFALVAVVDLAFLPLLIAALARPIVAARNRRNYPLVIVLGGLFLCNAFVHAQALGLMPMGSARRACLMAVDLVLLVVLIIIGRVLPMFTRNATQATDIRSSVALDRICIASMVLLAVCDAAWPQTPLTVAAAVLAALSAAARAWRWGAQHTLRHPLLWILHTGYAWIVIGFGMRALAGLGVVPASLATHALTVGVIGTLTLGMMARVALGHTGRALVISRSMTCAFIAINLAVAARAVLPWLAPSWYLQSLWLAGGLWTLAFLLFVFRYAPVLWSRRADGKPG
ncbi:MAG TPA: NnrS family protein [Polyangiales bacterium]|nr:NnrS family protein [Polyangiales bacterium]